MKILNAYVEGFGCLKQKEYIFDGGLNTLFLDNGEGKSTLAAFIKAMFYGLENTRSQSAEENDYLKYKPFEGGQFGGALTFEKDGKKYRIERYFDAVKSGKEDFKLYCGGAPSGDYSSKIGEEVFGLDGGGFEKSVYLPQKEVDRKVNDSIAGRLSFLAEQSGDKLSCEGAAELLKKRKNDYELEKNTLGNQDKIIPKQKRQIYNLNQELRRCRESKANVAAIATTQNDIRQKLSETASEIEKLEEKIARIFKAEHKKRLKEEFDKLQGECEEIQKEQEAFLADFGSFEKANTIIERVNYLKNALQELEGKEKEKNTDLDNKAKQTDAAYKKTMLLCVPLWALSLILILAGIFIVGIDTLLGVLLLVLGFIALFIGAFRFIFYKIASKTQSAPLSEIKNPYQNQIAGVKDELREKEIKYGDLELLSQAAEMYKNRGIILKQKRENLQNILNDADFDAFFKPFPYTAQDLEGVKNVKKQEERRLYEDLNSLKIQLEREELNAQKEGDILLDIFEAEEKLKQYEGEFEALKGAINFLEKARENLKNAYLPQMNANFKKYIKYFDNPLELSLDKELEIKLTHGGKTQSGSHLSKGFWDLADFCCRLSLAEALSKKGETPLILDDPFVNFDDKRVKLAKELVINLAKERQVIYFTCHTSRKI